MSGANARLPISILIKESFQTKVSDYINENKQNFTTVNRMMKKKNQNQEDQEVELFELKNLMNLRKEHSKNLFEKEINQCEDFIIC